MTLLKGWGAHQRKRELVCLRVAAWLKPGEVLKQNGGVDSPVRGKEKKGRLFGDILLGRRLVGSEASFPPSTA